MVNPLRGDDSCGVWALSDVLLELRAKSPELWEESAAANRVGGWESCASESDLLAIGLLASV
ncbi:MAG: hypothetical protein K1X71_06585 [Pirellulales bacterium]|nr:hypothetical protein [Pirellulales bacterium]